MSAATRRQFLLASAGAVAPVAAQSLAEEHPDAELIALGRLFDLGFAAYRDATRKAKWVDADYCARNDHLLKGGFDSDWQKRRDTEVDPFVCEKNAIAERLDFVTTRIRKLPAKTFQGIAVKANTLRFDLSIWCDDPAPRGDWDHEEDCLAIFIDEAKRLAAQERAAI